MESILCLIDYKANSEQVLLYALYLAKKLHADLALVHIFESAGEALIEGESGQAEGNSNPEDQQRAELLRLKQFTQSTASQFLQEIDIRYIVAGGSRRERITEFIATYDIELVVMGMGNRKGFAGRLFGNLALKMIDQGPCPLLLIPPEANFRKVSNIIYATDFSYNNLNAIELLLQWSEGLDAGLSLVHVSEDPEDNQWASVQMDKIKRTFEDETADEDRMQFAVLTGEVQETLETYIEKTKADIIALTTHPRSIWDQWMATSLAKNLAEAVAIPLLVFKE